MSTSDGSAGLPAEIRPHLGQLPGPGQTLPTPSAAGTTPGLSPLAASRYPGAPVLPDPTSTAAASPFHEPLRFDAIELPSWMTAPPGPAPAAVRTAPASFPTEWNVPLLDHPDAPATVVSAVPAIGPPDAPPPEDDPGNRLDAEELHLLDILAVPLPGPSTAGPLDAHALKREFPILGETIHGRPLVWLDNAATTQKPNAVIERIAHFYRHENSNIHRAAHTLAARATDAYEAARESARRFLGAGSVDEIVFVRGATEGINLVAQAWGGRHVAEGDEIVITWLEHHANIVPWQQLSTAKGARLRVAPVDDRGQLILDEFERLLGPRTRLVAFPLVSNALGTITPAREIVEMAHRHGAVVLVDAAQAVSHMPVDVQALGCDLLVLSGHKVFGPTGIGVLYGRRELLAETPPWQGGGNMIEDVTFERTVYQKPPARFEAGTGSIADAVGLGAAFDWLSGLGLPRVEAWEHELLGYATERLLEVPGLRLIGTAAAKAAVLSFVLAGHAPEEVGRRLDAEGIAVRAGHHCAQPILRRFGLESTVRASLAPYNTRDDVDALVEALARIHRATTSAR